MKKVIFVIILAIFMLWPVGYYTQNKLLSLSPRHIFESDYQAEQLILRNINLYPNIPLARFFQNKLIIISNKYLDNLFNFLDPNYYFFGSHPRESTNSQNYTRLPLLTILPIAFFLFSKNKYKKFLLTYFIFAILGLSFFTNHYIFDFILWPIFITATYFGSIVQFKKNKVLGILFLSSLVCESIYEIIRQIK